MNDRMNDRMNVPTNILLHTGYDVRPWSQELFEPSSYQLKLINSYSELSDILNVRELLIHGPSNLASLKYFSCCLQLLHSYNHKIVIEMPALNHDVIGLIHSSGRSEYEFVKSYLNTVIQHDMNIVPDTAHLYANGLNTDQIIEILHMFKDHYTFIHLNGNSNEPFKPDRHTTLTKLNGFMNNRIPDSERLLHEISKLNKICISEQKCNDIDYYKRLSNEYGFKLIDIPSNLII
jgi:endonuclease IV